MHIYAFQIAAFFMVTGSALAIRANVTARGIAVLGYAPAVDLPFASSYFNCAFLVFRFWMPFVSIYILTGKARA